MPTRRRLAFKLTLALVAASNVSGCATPTRSRGYIDEALRQRTGHGLGGTDDAPSSGPPEAATAVPLDEDRAVVEALAASPSFAADLTRLETARADFAEAARVANPRLSIAGPVGTIKSAVGLLAPIFDLIQLPQRTAAAGRALESVADSLVQSGLDLVRDVRVAHVEVDLAARRLVLLRELAQAAAELATIAETRVAAGDLGPEGELAARADAEAAADRAAVGARDRVIAAAQLAVLLGREAGAPLEVVSRRALPDHVPALVDLLAVARVDRPDVRAAELELEAAATRAGWERTRILNISASVDLQWDSQAIGARVGGQLELPIFNQNQGGRGRADAAVVRARYRVDAVRQQVTFEVVRARAQLAQALDSLARYSARVVPPLDSAFEAASLRFELGEDDYVAVADARTRLDTALIRKIELEADVRRALAELERSVGARLEVQARRESRVEQEPSDRGVVEAAVEPNAAGTTDNEASPTGGGEGS